MFAIFSPHLGTVVNVNVIYISVTPACHSCHVDFTLLIRESVFLLLRLLRKC